jgi:hypothetical protein
VNEGAVIRAVCAPRSFAMNPDDCLVKSCVCSNDRLLMTPVIRGVLFFLPAPGRRARSLRPLGALQPCSVGGLGLLRLRPAGMAAQAAPPAPGWPPCSRLRTSAGSPVPGVNYVGGRLSNCHRALQLPVLVLLQQHRPDQG